MEQIKTGETFGDIARTDGISILLENYYMPGALEEAIVAFVDNYRQAERGQQSNKS